MSVQTRTPSRQSKRDDSTERDARPVFGYVRVSTDSQELTRQLRTIPETHKRLPDGLGDNELILFEDHGKSGFDPTAHRPGFEELQRRLEKGEASALLVDTSSRLTRQGVEAAVPFYFALGATRTRFFTTTGREYTQDPAGLIQLVLDSYGDKGFSLALKHNTTSGKRSTAANGYWPHGKAPLGYVSVPAPDNPKRRILAPGDEAAAVCEAFRLYDEERATQRDVVRYLTATLGRRFDRTYAKTMLRNIVYLGKVRNNGEIFDGLHPALITEERFERVKRRLDREAATDKRQPRAWAFAGIARCAECGRTMRFRPQRNGRYKYVCCTNSNFPAKVCGQGSLPAASFEANFAFYLAAFAHTIRHLLDANPAFAVPEETGGDLSEAQAALEAARKRLDTLVSLIADETLSLDDPRYQRAKKEREAAEERVRELSGTARSYREELESFVRRVESLACALPPWHLKQIERDHVAALTPAGTDVFGDRFAWQVVAGWEAADLQTQRELVERTFSRIDADRETLTLHFHNALPDSITLPALFEYGGDDRAAVEAEGFGNLDEGLVRATGSKPS